MPHKIILNGKSSASQSLRDAVARLRHEGFEIDVEVTWEAGDAARLAQTCVANPATRIIAAGGDGTVNEVINAMMVSRAGNALGIVPFGTANDFAAGSGIPHGDPYAALLLALTGQPRAVDIGMVNGRHFINLASGGFGADVTAATDPALKRTLGGAAYSLMALVMAMRATPLDVLIKTPGQNFEGPVLMLAVGNGRQAGGGIRMTPRAKIDDGLLDLVIVRDHPRARFEHLLADLIELKQHGGDHFDYVQATSIEIVSLTPMQFNLDGEPLLAEAFAFSVSPRALYVVLPGQCELLLGTN